VTSLSHSRLSLSLSLSLSFALSFFDVAHSQLRAESVAARAGDRRACRRARKAKRPPRDAL